jgi:L,D-transpeptidase catalytic domain
MARTEAGRRTGLHRLARRTALAITAGLALVLLTAAPAWAAGISYNVEPAQVLYNQPVTFSGVVDPVAAGQQVIVALNGVDATTLTTDAAGAFTYEFTPKSSGIITARLAADQTVVGAEVPYSVQPRVTWKVTKAEAFFRASIRVRVTPRQYTGRITATVQHNGEAKGTAHTWVKKGVARIVVPAAGIGQFKVEMTLSPTKGFAERTVEATFRTRYRALKIGSTGPDVRLLLRALANLKFRIPGVSSTLNRNAADSILAFQKAYGLPRTYAFGPRDWAKLDVAKVIKPKYSQPALHIEIDKGRQILMVVKNGEPWTIICVSTGATNNTPEGTHAIEWKAYSAPTPYGGLLYWDMQFYPSFAMHAYPIVPPYPASHGCVREPEWVAPYIYSISSVGETVYVYH